MSRARYVMFGGFLGAGKTTAVLAYARHLREQGKRVGLVTNDQSVGLVDTRMLAHHGFPTEEITGGCFCCRFSSLVDAAETLARGSDGAPEVLIAEPVGSCTDLLASVAYPLHCIYGERYEVAPLSVVVDPARALRVLGIEQGKRFSPKVRYVYEKQLEEAELLILNKADRVEPERLERLEQALAARFDAQRLRVSAREGQGLEAWWQAIERPLRDRPALELDYPTYADGEALLGWLNASVTLAAERALDGNALLEQLAADVRGRLHEDDHRIAHLKMTLTPHTFGGDLGVLNLTSDDGPAELSHRLDQPLAGAELIVNLRAEGDPEQAAAAVRAALTAREDQVRGLNLVIDHLEQFRPPPPEPTHRYASASGGAS